MLGSNCGYGDTRISCIHCAEYSGKIAVAWGTDAMIFEPELLEDAGNRSSSDEVKLCTVPPSMSPIRPHTCCTMAHVSAQPRSQATHGNEDSSDSAAFSLSPPLLSSSLPPPSPSSPVSGGRPTPCPMTPPSPASPGGGRAPSWPLAETLSPSGPTSQPTGALPFPWRLGGLDYS